MIPPDGVKGKLDGVVDSLPPDKGCEVLELAHGVGSWLSHE